MQYVKVENGQVVSTTLPKVGKLKDGSSVSGYDRLKPEVLKAEGWLPLTESKLAYDEKTQYLSFDKYIINTDSVVAQYKVNNIVVPQITPEQEIAQLKVELSATDYKIIKYSEYQLAGLDLPYDVAELHTIRQALRDRINDLEEK